jgi:RimJ/RimL family protein N-acetyltransferase
MQIQTERLVIRDLRAGDIEILAGMWADSELTRYLGGPRDPDQLRAGLVKDMAASGPVEFDLWPVIERSSGCLVGHCGLLEKEVDGRVELELVYVLVRPAWGQGYATEAGRALLDYAFGNSGFSRVIALIDPDHTASQRVATRLGMHYEQTTLRPGGKQMQVYVVARSDR